MSCAPILFLALLSAAVSAPLDAQADQGYSLQIVLHVADHRLLTPLFKEKVEGDIRAGLTFGELARVEILHDHPQMKEIEKRGLESGLDDWQGAGTGKTHFVWIDYRDGRYIIEAWQHDGLTGQVTSVVRREETPDRQRVGNVAARLVARDFAPVGTIVEKDRDTVRVVFRGSKRPDAPEPPSGWAREGQVLAVARITRAGADERATAVRWTLLRVEKVDKGTCTCRLFSGLKDPLTEAGDIVGYRCIALATTRSALHLRFVRKGTGEPLPNLVVDVQRRTFDADEQDTVQGVTDRLGYFKTADRDTKPFDDFALVRILSPDNKPIARVPLAVIGTDPVVIALNIDQVEDDPLLLRRELWEESLDRSIRKQNDVFRELRELVKAQGKREAALKQAEQELESLKADTSRLTQTADSLRTASKGKLDLTEGEQRLGDLTRGENELRSFVQRQKTILDSEKDPRWMALQDKIQQAHLLEREAEFGNAIELYQQAVDAGVEDAPLLDHLADLKKGWRISNARHQKTRDFVYQTWPQFDETKLSQRIDDARDALKVCSDAGDRLTPQKLLRVAIEHLGKIKEKLGRLHPDEKELDRKRAAELGIVVEKLTTLIKEVSVVLRAER